MPFAPLMTEILKRRENRDNKENHPADYIRARDRRDTIWLLNSIAITLAFAIYIAGRQPDIKIFPAAILFVLMIFCFWKFLSSCLYK